MSLDRFINKEEILSLGPGVNPIKWTDELNAGGYLHTIPQNINHINSLYSNTFNPSARPFVEAHFYDIENGNYVSSANFDLMIDPLNDSVNIQIQTLINAVDIKSGKYIVVFNIFQRSLGKYNDPAFKVVEMSQDRTEIHLKGNTANSEYETKTT
jgi:hypothetical protein